MKAFLSLFLLLSLTPAFSAQINIGEPTTVRAVKRIADEAQVIALWRTTLSNALKRVSDEDDEFPPKELQEIRKAINEALAALDKLYRARLLYGYTCIDKAFCAHALDEKAANRMRMEWKKLLDECAERDLQALSMKGGWISGSDLPRPLSHDMKIEMPRYIRALRNRTCRANAESRLRASCARESMREMVDNFSKFVFHNYDNSNENIETCDRESLTGVLLDDLDGTDIADLFGKLQKLYADAEARWLEYCGKVEALVSPCQSFLGSGSSEMEDVLVCHLINSRDIYLARIAAGVLNDPSWKWEIDGEAEWADE